MKLSLLRDALDCARNRMDVSDYHGFALRARGAGSGYHDRVRALDYLLGEGCIEVTGGKLGLNKRADWQWLGSLLREGSEEAWSIADTYVPSNAVWKVEETFRAEIGLEGELAVMRELEKSLPARDFQRVRHVSLTDDSAGYDILSPSLTGRPSLAMLEVKTSTRSSELFRFFISRNEISRGLNSEAWALVFVQLHLKQATVLGHLGIGYFSSDFPTEVSDSVRVSELEVEVSREDLIPGLP
jgi:hypothetical protein